MKKFFGFLTVLSFAAALGFTQNNVNEIKEIDQVARNLAISIHAKLLEKKAERIIIGQFVFQNGVPLLGEYLSNQLMSELTNMPRRNYTILSEQAAHNAQWVVSGEIVQTSDILRLYTRLVKRPDMSIEASFTSDFQRSEYIIGMISASGRSATAVRIDMMEPDSMSAPVSYEIAADSSSAVTMERALTESDSDYFLLIPKESGRITIETTGSTDTFMELYIEGNSSRLTSNDDGGAETNARINYSVNAGTRYIALVKGYESSSTGAYGFRAFLTPGGSVNTDEFEPDDESSQAKVIEIGSTQVRNFHHGDDVDWVKFEITAAGRYIINARGVNNNSLDTVIELYDDYLEKIAEDDDGGESYSARLSRNLRTGTYYLKIWCYDDDPDQGYTLSITYEP